MAFVWAGRVIAMLAACAVLLGFALPARASTFSDVPPEHWSYEALDYLQNAGLVEGYPDGTFKGERPFTRYEMAMVIARIFTRIQDWQAAETEEPAVADETVMAEVNARLDRLSDEFRDELADLGARLTAVEDEQAQIRSEMDDLEGLIKESGMTGSARWRAGRYMTTGDSDLDSDTGFESYINLTYKFNPDPNLDFKLSLTGSEIEGPAGTGFIPGANNETGSTNPGNTTNPGNVVAPFHQYNQGSSFIIDEANFRYCWCGAPELLGENPTITGGRQYFSQGEFGLAGDNGYRSNFGLRLDTDYGDEWGAYAGYYRVESLSKFAPFDNNDSNSFQSSGITSDGDDFMLLGLEFHSGEATVPGHDYKLAVRADVAPNGYGAEQYVSLSGNAEVPWFGDTWLNGVRGEWVMVNTNVAGVSPSSDLDLNNNSYILEADIFNNGRSRFSLAGASMAQIEGLPVYASVDNDPFSEWDFTINQTKDAFNLSREGRNYFPSDFVGFGIQAEHDFGSSLHGTLTYYNGKRVNAGATDRPGMLRVNLRMPVTDNSSMGLDFIAAGEHNGLADPISMIRGEYKINF